MFTALVLLQFFALFLLIIALVYIFRGSSTYILKLMLSFTLAEIVHNAGYLLELFARSEQEAMMAVKMEYLGSSLVATLFMMFIMVYCGTKEYRWFERFLLLCGCAVIVMVWTSEKHSLYYTDVDFVQTGAYRPLFLFAYGYVMDEGEAENIVQSVFTEMWEKRKNLPENLNLRAYLYSSVKHACLRYFKRLQLLDEYKKRQAEALILSFADDDIEDDIADETAEEAAEEEKAEE